MEISKSISRRAFMVAVGALGVAAFGSARAESYPRQRVTMIVPFPSGTAVDTVARFLAVKLEKQWGQPVIIENRAGADGVIGTRAVMSAPPDGHTILFTAPTFLFVPFLNSEAGYNPLQDFVPVARATIPVYMLAAHPSRGFTSFSDMVAASKRTGGRLDVGVAGSHSAAAASGMARAAGIEVNIVNYKTTGQLISDGIGGHVPLVLSALGSLIAFTRDGKLRAMAVTGAKRSIIAPDVPTAMEAGAKGFSLTSWNGAFVRQGTPDAIVRAITEGVRKATAGDDFLQFCRQQGLEPAFESGPEWANALPAERTLLADLLRQSGILQAR